jgi:hypothetical protein
VTSIFFLGYTAVGEDFEFEGKEWKADSQDFELAIEVANLTENLLAEGKLKPHPGEVREGGLEQIDSGLQDLKSGKVSGKKLVYVLS